MIQIEAVWEAKMDAHIIDNLTKYSNIAKKFADQDQTLVNRFNALKTLLESRFEELETAMKAMVDLLESNLKNKLDSLEADMAIKVDVMEAKVTNMVCPKFSDMDSDFGQ